MTIDTSEVFCFEQSDDLNSERFWCFSNRFLLLDTPGKKYSATNHENTAKRNQHFPHDIHLYIYRSLVDRKEYAFKKFPNMHSFIIRFIF